MRRMPSQSVGLAMVPQIAFSSIASAVRTTNAVPEKLDGVYRPDERRIM
jgi:hypothetical protein